MKKFLTVLLALSVVFTYTVGTAFAALPSDDGTAAGLASAKAEAVKELEAYPTLSDYDATGQAKIKAYIAEYTDKINDATAVGKKTDTAAEKTVYGYLNAGKALIDRVSTIDELEAAKEKALDQFNDYVYLIDNNATLNMSITADVVKAANVGYADYDTFKTQSIKSIKGAVDVEAVESALNTAIEKADKIYAQLEEIEVPQSDIDNLVKDIRTKAASYNVNSKTHSTTVIAAYEEAIETGVAAAKAIKTWEDYFAVYDKYLGCTTTAVKAEKNSVYVHISQKSVFEVLKNKTLEVEADIKAVELLLANLGDYDWKEYVDAVAFNDARKWENIEEFYYQAEYFVKNGAFDGTLSTASAPAALKNLISVVKASSNTNAINEAVSNAEAAIKDLTVLEGYKNALIADIKSYYGTDLKPLGDPTAVNAADRYGENYSYLQAVQTRAANAIGLATSIDAADKVYAEYIDRIDDIKTVKEKELDKYIADYNEAVDQYVIDNKADMSADAEILLNRIVKDLKENFVSAERLRLFDADGEDLILAFAVQGKAYGTEDYSGANFYYAFADVDMNDYYTENGKHVQAVIDGFNDTVAGTQSTKITSWAEFFAAYDKAASDIDKYPTKVQEDYITAVKAADAAIDTLGAPALTAAFKNTLAKVDKAYAAYEKAAAAFYALPEDEQEEVTVALAGGTKYADTKHEYNRLVYLDGQQEGVNHIKEVQDFVAVAGGFLSTGIQKYYDNAGKLQIATIIDDTYKAIDVASTDDAKAASALEGIAKLDAVELNNAVAQDIADLLVKVKADAAEYFKKYENATFTSDATTKLGLVKDIIEFNAQFSDTVKKQNEALKAAVNGTHMKIGSSAAKGYIKISWKASNTTVALDGVEVYRSTKKTTDFKKISTFKVQTSKKYTTGLKKGTKYYYYVKGYKMVDGEKVYTHDSITVGRTFR